MSYLTQAHIAENHSMLARVAQAAASEGNAEPDAWTYKHRRTWAAAPGWDDAWEYAENTHPSEPPEPPFDPGTDEAVITDGMILAQVQQMLTGA